MTNPAQVRPSVAPAAITPVLAGFYPDPSVCRAGDIYYLATSSFEYRPAIPLFKSRDLVTWTAIGHALSSASQLPEDAGAPSTGIYAPTIRYHEGRFWIASTNVSAPYSEHLIIHAVDPAGPWSEPVIAVGARGIDPDLTWDGDICYLSWTTSDPENPAILQARIDPFNGQLHEAPRVLWRGTGMAYPEAPHLYLIGGWWYLLIAEGGTERGHAISIARSRSIQGPFEASPANPILSHRSLLNPVQNTGHGDLIQAPDGTWRLVYLGVRPRGTSPGFHVNGRETFITEVDWKEDWPVIRTPGFDVPVSDRGFVDNFEGDTLHSRWVSPGRFPDRFAHVHGGAVSFDAATVDGVKIMLLSRVEMTSWEARAVLSLGDGESALTLRIDNDHWCALEARRDRFVAAHSTRLGRQEMGAVFSDNTQETTMYARAISSAAQFGELGGPDTIELGLIEDGARKCIARFDGRYISTEVAGGFTGRMVGVVGISGRVIVRAFEMSMIEV